MLQGEVTDLKDWNNRSWMTVTILKYNIMCLGTSKNLCYRDGVYQLATMI